MAAVSLHYFFAPPDVVFVTALLIFVLAWRMLPSEGSVEPRQRLAGLAVES